MLMLLAAAPDPARELVGIWEAKRHFGPEVRGTLTIERTGETWRAEIGADSVEAHHQNGRVAFELPGDRGSFSGKLDRSGAKIQAHWAQPRTAFLGYSGFATPVQLSRASAGRWRGEVTPLEDVVTLYLVVQPNEDGSTRAFLRNPERNIGVFYDLARIRLEGDAVQLTSADGKPVLTGQRHRETNTLSIHFPTRGGTYDFALLSDAASHFYPRGKNAGRYRYRPPSREDDGWPTAALDEVRMSPDRIVEMVQTILDGRAQSLGTLDTHGVLIARHGKLVLEEYFHGYHRNRPHDTRSASKSLASTLVGAAIQQGAKLAAATRVYEVMGQGGATLDARRRAMTVEHLMTMSSGLDCDDSDPKSLGNEDVLQEQTAQPDWWQYTLALPMVRQPGIRSVYCSASTNLIGGVLRRATGEPVAELFHRLIAEPLGIGRYHLNLMPNGEAYLGGGIYWLPRGFMKLGQLILNGGTWNGRRVISPEWARRATSPIFDVYQAPPRRYGYAWWSTEFSHQGRTVRAFYAAGNGGQLVIGVPEMDLLVAFYGGNYSDRVSSRMLFEWIPKYVLPALNATQ